MSNTTRGGTSHRLKILHGQLQTLIEMSADESQDCVAFLTQLKAVKSGVNAVIKKVAEESLYKCTHKGKPQEDELKRIIASLVE